MRLLVTRPQSDAERTATALRERGHEVTIAPLLRIEAITDLTAVGTAPWAAILVTSANAAAAAIVERRQAEALRGVPVFAVGRRSAQAMRAAGFADVSSAEGGVDDLVRLVTARMRPGGALLYLAGEQRCGDLAGALGSAGFAVHTAVIYRAVAAAELPQAARDALTAGIDGVLHFSRRSAEAYVNAARNAAALESALRPAHFCLSAQIAEPLRRAGAGTIHVAPRPAEAALIDLISMTAKRPRGPD
jgi:uroporphyrinogen-III synthase